MGDTCAVMQFSFWAFIASQIRRRNGEPAKF